MIKPGMFIGDRYEIIDKVGSGGMADVYKAKCHKLNRFVAVKIMKAEFSDDRNFISKFRAEAQSAAGLSHPNIVNVYDVGEDDGLYYIVMELVEGITLKDFIDRKGRLDVRESVGIAIQIAQGMEAAHANNIIHRDIKPQNIIISKEGKVKVADFGIAKATTSNTLTSNAMGSVHYISPEQARGGYSDEKSDIYSLGVTMYEMISGQVPFEGDSAVSIALLHIQSEAPTLGEIIPNVPISVDKIVQKCMQKKPERRYLSAGELIADLKHSILEPNVDFVVISSAMATGSPTIALSQEDLDAIRNGVKNPDNYDDPYMDQQQLMEDYNNGYDNGYDDYNNNGYDNGYDDYNNNGYDDQMYSSSDMQDDSMDPMDDEEASDDTVDPKMEKTAKYITYGVVGILVLVLLYLIYVIITGGDGDKTTPSAEPTIQAPTGDDRDLIKMIDVTGKTFDEAKEMIVKEMGIEESKIEQKTKTTDDESKVGKVVDSSPKAGDETSKDKNVVLYIGSNGSEKLETVPNVVGLTYSEAKLKLANKFPNAKFDPSNADGDAKVVSTSPAPNEEIEKNFSGTFKISLEANGITVPDVRGKSEERAKKLLRSAGINNINVKYSDSDSEDDSVIDCSPSSGVSIDANQQVTITVAKKKKKNSNVNVEVAINKPDSLGNNPWDSKEATIKILANGSVLAEEKDTLRPSDFLGGQKKKKIKVQLPDGVSENNLNYEVWVDGQKVQ